MTGLALPPLGATAPQAALLLLGCRAPRLGTRARVALLHLCAAPLGPSALALPARLVRVENILILAALLAQIARLEGTLTPAALLAPIVRGVRTLPLAHPRAAGVMLENTSQIVGVGVRTVTLESSLCKVPDLVLRVMQAGLAPLGVTRPVRAMEPAQQAPMAPPPATLQQRAMAPVLLASTVKKAQPATSRIHAQLASSQCLVPPFVATALLASSRRLVPPCALSALQAHSCRRLRPLLA